jgi:hypothetical protein
MQSQGENVILQVFVYPMHFSLVKMVNDGSQDKKFTREHVVRAIKRNFGGQTLDPVAAFDKMAEKNQVGLNNIQVAEYHIYW